MYLYLLIKEMKNENLEKIFCWLYKIENQVKKFLLDADCIDEGANEKADVLNHSIDTHLPGVIVKLLV